MRLFCIALLLAAVFRQPLYAGWRTESSTARPTRSAAITHTVQKLRNEEGRSLSLHLVRFDRARTALKVIDLPAGSSVAEGVREAGALAGVNGGYFQKDRTPLGLMISGGKTVHPQEKSKILSGVVVVTPHGAALLRNAEYKGGSRVKEALQAGPYLVDGGATVAGLNATRPAERTVLLADQQGVAAFLITGPVTLAELGRILAWPGLFPGLTIHRALNLDGGSSTALWVDAPEPFSHSEWKRVRNAVIVVPK